MDVRAGGYQRRLPFTENPCLASQVQWSRDNGKPTQAYTMAGFPTSAQLSTYAASGPWSSRTRAGALSNVGYSEGRYALAALSRGKCGIERDAVDVTAREVESRTSDELAT